ncbi:MAG: N-(5'-phosphoribosyl)anthranilate isomerase [Elusimicrobia bacterium]|nr:MAG: N-(5'-phosphoribosyl)anthranilate isomerase [Elusimicrobiota bacterium]
MATPFKVCCIASAQEAALAIRHGAAALGLVSEMPSGPGVISLEQIAEIVKTLPPGVASFLLTSKQNTAEIIEQQRQTQVNTIQLCDRITEGSFSDLRDAFSDVALVNVVHVQGEESIQEAVDVAPHVEALLLDSGSKTSSIKILGGTGRTHNWDISRRITDAVKIPVYLAGGLNAGNVKDAVSRVNPYAVDICNGIRTDGRLDEEKLQAFAQALQGT